MQDRTLIAIVNGFKLPRRWINVHMASQLLIVVTLCGLCLPVRAQQVASPDLNGDGVVNVVDLSMVAQCVGLNLTQHPQCLIADTNGDGAVDSKDVSFVRSGFRGTGLRITQTANRIAGAASGALTSPIVSVQPATKNAAVGDPISLNINISGVTDLYAFQFDLSFAPTVLSGISTSEGSFLPTGGGTFFIPGTVDNAGGFISLTADTLLTAISGINGGGTLATVQLSALASGSTPISISNVILLDSNLNTIAATTLDAVVIVSVTDKSVSLGLCVPFPITLALPAGPNGIFLTLTSSDPSKVTLSPGMVNSITIFIPAGAFTDRRTPEICGVGIGSATITVSGNGLQPTTQSVRVVGTLSFLSSSVIITGARQARLTLSLPAPAPAAGVTVNSTSEDPLVASVPALVVIQANTTSTTVPVTGVAAGSTITVRQRAARLSGHDR